MWLMLYWKLYATNVVFSCSRAMKDYLEKQFKPTKKRCLKSIELMLWNKSPLSAIWNEYCFHLTARLFGLHCLSAKCVPCPCLSPIMMAAIKFRWINHPKRLSRLIVGKVLKAIKSYSHKSVNVTRGGEKWGITGNTFLQIIDIHLGYYTVTRDTNVKGARWGERKKKTIFALSGKYCASNPPSQIGGYILDGNY